MSNVKTKVALVTGGNSGIGYATAKTLKENGYAVIITGRRPEAVEKAAAELGVAGMVANQASISDISALAEKIKKAYGQVDVLFINAGVSKLFRVEDAMEEAFDEMMDINFKGAYFTLSKFIPLLPNGASVIFLSSIVASHYHLGSSIYSASKAALNAALKTAALELAPRQVRVNAISPGPTKTEVMKKAGLDEKMLEQVMSAVEGRIPLGRMAEPKEISHLVSFLADANLSGFITGSEFIVDGGLVLA